MFSFVDYGLSLLHLIAHNSNQENSTEQVLAESQVVIA